MGIRLSELIARRDADSGPTDEEIRRGFEEMIDDRGAAIEQARSAGDSGAYGSLEIKVKGHRRELERSIQGLTRDRMWEVIRRLRGGLTISDEDWRLVRLWLIGDADAYVDEENNFGDWMTELARIQARIESLRSQDVETQSLRELDALLTDAHSLILSISTYLTTKERVEHFERTASGDLDPETRTMLADILTGKYHARVV